MEDPFEKNAQGRTSLFDAAARGDLGMVEKIIYSLPGTGFYPARLAILTLQDNAGLTAADVAEQHGHIEIAELLRGDIGRMEYYE